MTIVKAHLQNSNQNSNRLKHKSPRKEHLVVPKIINRKVRKEGAKLPLKSRVAREVILHWSWLAPLIRWLQGLVVPCQASMTKWIKQRKELNYHPLITMLSFDISIIRSTMERRGSECPKGKGQVQQISTWANLNLSLTLL